MQLTSGADIDAEPLWSILSRSGRRVGLLNIPTTYPPRKINGFMVTGMLTPPSSEDYTYPRELRSRLEKAVGGYTVLPSELLHARGREAEHLLSVQRVAHMRMQAANWLMREYDWDFFMVVFGATDQIQHALWHLMDETHSRHQPRASDEMRHGIRRVCQQLNAYLTDLLGRREDDTLLIIMSDHGFGPLERYIYLNNWLLSKGMIRLRRTPEVLLKYLLYRLGFGPANLYKRGLTPARVFKLAERVGFSREQAQRYTRRSKVTETLVEKIFLSFRDVDWQRTKAYSLGNAGPIYINLKGREPEGNVEAGVESEQLINRLTQLLDELKDPGTGQPIMRSVHRREDIYWGERLSEAPDLILIPEDMRYAVCGDYEFPSNQVVERCFDRTGGHRMNGLLMLRGPGVKQGYRLQGAQIIDLAPTILAVMGVPIPSDMDGKVLTEAFADEFWAGHPPVRAPVSSPKEGTAPGLSPEDEEAIKERLRGLGYLA